MADDASSLETLGATAQGTDFAEFLLAMADSHPYRGVPHMAV